jgi:putative transcriptional regulator
MGQHSPEGAYGLTLNRRADVTVGDLLADHPLLAGHSFPIYAGGPVALDTLQLLHRAPAEIPGGITIADNLFLGGELESMATFVSSGAGAEDVLRLIIGYSGWGAGQLDGELKSGSWIPASIEPGWIFEFEGEALWRRVLRSLGQEGEDLASLPPDPSWN